MKYQIILCVLLSLLIIILTHRFYDFLKNTLTIPKVKDLVDKPRKRYNEILTKLDKHKTEYDDNIITLKHNKTVNEIDTSNIVNTTTNTSSNTSSNNVNQQMKDELSLFLEELKSNSDKGVKE